MAKLLALAATNFMQSQFKVRFGFWKMSPLVEIIGGSNFQIRGRP